MTYPGGKNGAGVYQTIINQIPPHDTYVEAFAGSAAIFRNKRRARHSILIELGQDQGAELSHEFLCKPGVEVLKTCGVSFMKASTLSSRHDVFWYFDPPYVRSARRSSRDMYECEWTDQNHLHFLHHVRTVRGMVMISGYPSELYERALSDWRRVEFQAMTRRGLATEVLWMNYPEPKILHDPSYLGDDFRERERIKRKAQRWARKFEELEPRERCAVLSAVLARPDTATAFQAMIDHRQLGRCDPTNENDEGRFQ